MAVHAQIRGYTSPEYSSSAGGQDQEPPQHSHDALGYQKFAAATAMLGATKTSHPHGEGFGVSFGAKRQAGEAPLQ
jgi:hypothetical protein